MSIALGRLWVPLKNMCSKKWEMPLVFLVSYRLPAPHKTIAVTDLNEVSGASTTRRPLGKVSCSNSLLDIFFRFTSYLFSVFGFQIQVYQFSVNPLVAIELKNRQPTNFLF